MDFNSSQPIYIQIAENLETMILNDMYGIDEQIPSTTEISTMYKINPATVLKGMNILVDAGIIYKKRGLGMFVAKESKEIIRKKRMKEFTSSTMKEVVDEAVSLGISEEELINFIKEEFKNGN